MYDPHSSKKSVRLSLVATLYATSFLWGFCQVICGDPDTWYYIFSPAFAGAAAWWVAADAKARGKPVVHIAQLFIFYLWQIAVPAYLITSRGLRGLGIALLHAFGLLVALLAGFYIAHVATAW